MAAGKPIRYRDAVRRAERLTKDERLTGGMDAYDAIRARLLAGRVDWVVDRPGYVEVRTDLKRDRGPSSPGSARGTGQLLPAAPVLPDGRDGTDEIHKRSRA